MTIAFGNATPARKTQQEIEEEQQEQPDVLAPIELKPRRESEEPRTFSQIRANHSPEIAQQEKVGGVPIKPWMLIASGVGAALAIITAVVLATAQAPQQVVTPDVQPQAQTTALPSAVPTVNASDPSLPLSQRYPIGGAQQPAQATESDNTVAVEDATLTINADGSMQIEIAANTQCFPAWSSPPPSWSSADVKQLFKTERNGCFQTDASNPTRITGWYGDTNWIYVIRDKEKNDLVWIDVTWIGHTMGEVKALPEAVNGTIKDLKPAPVPTAVPTDVPAPVQQPAQDPVYVPAPVVPTDLPPPPTEPPPPPPTATEHEGGTKGSGSKPTGIPQEKTKSVK